MSNSLKISADTSEAKKSILGLGKEIMNLKGSKVQVFSADERKFIKTEMGREISRMKQKLKDNREEIKKAMVEQQKMVEGSKEELEMRKKILDAYKTQAKLARELGQAQKSQSSVDSNGGGMLGGLMKFAKAIPGLAAVAAIGYAVSKGTRANDQYVQGAPNRNRLKGLGVDDTSFGSAESLARVGLTEQDLIQRRIDATSILGRSGTSNDTEMRKAGFERAFGLDSGKMTGIAGQLRGQLGGSGATDAQMKLQASVFAAGIEDAVGPYLESAVQLLTSINENGTSNTAELTAMLAQLTKDGQRTPEQLAKMFGGIDSSVRGASGEQSAFLQSAFARSGIGGGTLGGTKFSMASGGIMGLNREQLEKRGYNKELLDNMEQSGMFSGVGKRTGAILDQVRSSGGLKPGEAISGVKDTDRMVGLGNLASSALGIKDPSQAFDALMMMEKVQNKQMSQKDFDKRMTEMQEGNDPSLKRLDNINGTLAGQTELLRSINTNLMESLGKQAVVAGNEVVKLDNKGINQMGKTAEGINQTGAVQGAGSAVGKAADFIMGGGVIGMVARKAQDYFQDKAVSKATSDDAIVNFAKKRRDEGTGFVGMTDEQIEQKVRSSLESQAKSIGKAIGENVKLPAAVNNNNIKVQNVDGRVSDRTQK